MNHKFICLLFLFFFQFYTGKINAQIPSEVLLQQARVLEKNNQDDQALLKYEEYLKIVPSNVTINCKLSELYSRVGKMQKGKQVQTDYYKKASLYASKALKLQPASAEAHFVMSVAYGNLAIVAFGADKIDAVRKVKYYAEKTVQLDPNNFKGYHVLGKWNAEVSALNSVEKWLVKVTFGGLPPASFDKAIECFDKSRKLNPSFLLNYLELAKCYLEKDDKRKAGEMLQFIEKAPMGSSEDLLTKKEAEELTDRF